MSPGFKALLGLSLGALWFGFLGPFAADALTTARADALRSPTASDLLQGLDHLSSGRPDLAPSPATRARIEALLDASMEDRDVEDAWNLQVGVALSEAQRAEGETLAATMPTVKRLDGGNVVEPELPVLAVILMRAHGYAEVAVPPPPAIDPWPGRTRRDRARALIALAEGPGLSGEQAHLILTATLRTLRAQDRRAEVEKAAFSLLSPEARTEVLLGLGGPGSGVGAQP